MGEFKMSEEEKKTVDLSFKFEEMYQFLEDCIDAWSKKIAEPIGERSDRFQWLIDMNTRATILTVKLKIFEGSIDAKRGSKNT
jgi:hypothetical protein